MQYSFVPALVLMASFSVVSCGHGVHKVEGEEKPSEIPAGIRVQIGGKEVTAGEKVDVLKQTCSPTTIPVRGGGMKTQRCKNQKVGEATVLKVLDHDSAVVSPNGDLQIDSKMLIEKKK